MGWVGPPERGQLVEVVHHPHRVEAGVLCRGRHVDDAVEEGAGRLAGGEVGDLQSEAHGAEPSGAPGTPCGPSPAGAAAEPGQRHLSLRGLEGAQRRQAGRRRAQRVRHEEAR